MEQVIKQMLDKYEIKNSQDKTNAIKEILQEIVLCGLSRAGFFKNKTLWFVLVRIPPAKASIVVIVKTISENTIFFIVF